LASLDDKRLKKELVMLFIILVALGTLAIRPFGFHNFIHGLANNDLFSILLIIGIVGVSLVMLQRLGIIFADTSAEKVI
jgi:hypothetical protein